MKLILFFILFLNFLLSAPVSADTKTLSIDLGDRSHLPLYDCDIYATSRDQQKCQDLRRDELVRWEDNGYAVSCFDLSRSRREMCLALSEEVLFDSERLSCIGLYERESKKRCQIVKKAYSEGRFIGSEKSASLAPRSCNVNAFDKAEGRWKKLKDDRTQKSLKPFGLIEVKMTDKNYPHSNPHCLKDLALESRMVTLEKQECVATRYTEVGRFSTRSYFEINCSSKRYITFDELGSWENGRRVTYFKY